VLVVTTAGCSAAVRLCRHAPADHGQRQCDALVVAQLLDVPQDWVGVVMVLSVPRRAVRSRRHDVWRLLCGRRLQLQRRLERVVRDIVSRGSVQGWRCCTLRRLLCTAWVQL
jgi:hypothetical protein